MNGHGTDVRPMLTIELTCKGVSTRLQFNEPFLRIGRRVENQPVPEIAVDDRTVSRKQAEIRWQGKNYWIADTDSLQGTYVNGERLLKGERRPLATGVVLDFGHTRASISIDRHSEGGVFDVFLCHSGGDKPQVRLIAGALRQAGLNPFLDEEGLAASTSWIAELSNVLRVIGVAGVLWGPNSPGRWQIKEIEVLQKAAIEEGLRLIPIILDGVQRDPTWPVFMDLVQRIDFGKPHLNPIDRLIATIRGGEPFPPG